MTVAAGIVGWGTALPEGRVTNADLEARLDTNDSWIVERTGIRERRVAGPGETTATLGADAATNAIKRAGLVPTDIDLLIVATATPEQPMPHTGAFVSEMLGLQCGSFDISAACAGFVYELVIGASMTNMGYEHVLLVGAETLSRIVDPQDRTTTVLFGDGAGAAVLAPTRETPGMLAWDLGCDGSAAALLEIRAGGSRLPASAATVADGEHYLKMQGQEVFRRAVRAVVDSAQLTLRARRGRRRSGCVVRAASGQCPHHRGRRQPSRLRGGAYADEHRPLRQYLLGLDPTRPVRGRRRRARARGRPRVVFRVRRGLDMGECTVALGRALSGPQDRVAFVTGGSRGIGRETVIALARAGHPVAFCYSSDAGGARETRETVEHAGGKALAVRADVADADAVDAAFREIESSFGPVTVLVNNAGITRDGLVVRMTDEHWRAVIDTNLTGAFHTIRRATPAMMKARFGRIVNVSSASAHIGQAGQANYAAAKAGLVGLTRSVARELARRNITCNVVAPGPIVTSMTDELTDEWRTQVETAVPLGRFGTAAECAAVIAFLCSEPAAYVTGAVVPVDGGLAMGH